MPDPIPVDPRHGKETPIDPPVVTDPEVSQPELENPEKEDED